MLVVEDAYDSLLDLPRGGVGTIGNFDGVHLGQRAILERVVSRARELGAPSVVITFDPHPLSVLAPSRAPLALTTARQKAALCDELGLGALLVVRFTQELARVRAEDFVRGFLCERVGLSELYVGKGFAFGRGRAGDLALLETMGAQLGFVAHGVDEVVLGGERISSTRIRQAVAEGDVAAAARLLGRLYTITGVIVRGDRMGQRLGWPTINVLPDHRLIPANGVYISRVFFPSLPAAFDCVTNVGTRPTIYENYQRVVESHILDFKTDVYGERVELSFLKRLREEKIFPTVMDLSAQIGRDVEATREFFARRRLEQEGPSAGLEE